MSTRARSAESARLSLERMLKLMAYADGELHGAELAEVEGWLATDVDAARFTNELADLGGLVKTGHDASSTAKAVASFDIADAVMAAVNKEKTAASEKTPSEKTKEPTKAPNVVSLEARRQKNLRVGGAVAAALAFAASVFVMTRGKHEAPMAQTVTPAPAMVASAEPGVDVDLVESPGESVRVFYLSSESSPTTSVVVWVDESGGK
jgi:anti-sigma factor RsiW